MRRLHVDLQTGRAAFQESRIRYRRAISAVLTTLLFAALITFLTQACRSSLALRVERLERIHVLEQQGRALREEMSRRLLEQERRHRI